MPATRTAAPAVAVTHHHDADRLAVAASGVETDRPLEMGAEDFAYFLNARPGAFLFLGQGGGPGVHHPAYDFNDAIAPVGASFFARLVETLQPA